MIDGGKMILMPTPTTSILSGRIGIGGLTRPSGATGVITRKPLVPVHFIPCLIITRSWVLTGSKEM